MTDAAKTNAFGDQDRESNRSTRPRGELEPKELFKGSLSWLMIQLKRTSCQAEVSN